MPTGVAACSRPLDRKETQEEVERRSNGDQMELEGELKEVREAHESGKTRSLSWRLSQLKALRTLLYDKEDDIFKALEQDLGKHRAEAYRDEACNLLFFNLTFFFFVLLRCDLISGGYSDQVRQLRNRQFA